MYARRREFNDLAPLTPAQSGLQHALLLTGAGDKNAFGTVYTLTFSKLSATCIRICGDRDAAEDVTSEVYATVWKRASQFDPERGSSIAWLSAIARNRSLDWRRSQRPMTNDELDQIEDDAPSALDAVIKQQQWQRVLKELAQLSAREREHLHAAFVDGESYVAIARRDGIPLGTMKYWMRRALMKVRSAVEEQALGYRA
ncbi:sigma-70 family RNA polymerase sigma factor [Brevundimonas sp. DC300-4]|uniref:sigma-70 family RNA polymerase sigma factor n=1 Tax=Brevundimonas sp. DC300-4 TaxID=2804594 RepID=UPI003CF74D94